MQIRVTQPFAFRASLSDPVKTFDPGRHELTQAEAEHPFLQACIAAGRAELLAHARTDDAQRAETAAATSPAGTSDDETSGGATSDGAADGATSGEEGTQAQGAGDGAVPPPRKRSARK